MLAFHIAFRALGPGARAQSVLSNPEMSLKRGT